MMQPGVSRSDLEALRSSGRGKFAVLAVLLAVALGAAGWSFLRRGGVGNPEDPAKVLVVSQGTTVGYSVLLKDAGFDAAEGTQQAWENKADEELPELEDTGLAAIITLADTFGYGYVAFERPQDVDFSALDIDGGVPELPDHVRFAVLSIGDFAFPHVMTVNPEPSKVMRDPGLVLLQALFAQAGLERLLPSNDNPTVEDIKLRDRLEEGLDTLARLPAAEQLADKVVHETRRLVVDEERAEPKPRLLADPLESTNPVPLASGPILSVARTFAIVSNDAVRADIDLDEEQRLLFGSATDEPTARQVCESLAGGNLSVHDSARYTVARDGSAVLIRSLSAEGLVLWTVDAEAGGCSFTSAGKVPRSAPGMEELGIPGPNGQVARTGAARGFAALSVLEAGSDDRQLLGMFEGAELGAPVWLDAQHLAAVGSTSYDDADSVYLFSTAAPLKVLRIDGAVFDDMSDLGQVALRPGAKPGLVVTAGSYPRRLYTLDLPAELAEMFAAPPDDAPPSERVGMPVIQEVDTNTLQPVALTHEGRVHDPVVSPDGRWVAFGLGDSTLDRPDASDDVEIAIAGTGPDSKMRLLTRNALHDHTPRFSADSKHVVFKTRVEIPKTKWIVTVARISAVQ